MKVTWLMFFDHCVKCFTSCDRISTYMAAPESLVVVVVLIVGAVLFILFYNK